MPVWVKGILVSAVLDNISDIEKWLRDEAKKTDNQLDDAIVDVFVFGVKSFLTAIK